MKYLEIRENKGYYWDGEKQVEIDKIDKEGLLTLLNNAEKDNFEIDAYQEELLQNKAHQIIYENIYKRLKQFLDDKDHFKRDVDNLFKTAIAEYSVDNTEQEVDPELGPPIAEDIEK